MSLTLVVGTNNTGKSKYLYMDALEKKNALIFVPSQSRMVAEEEYLECTNTNAMLYTEIYTLSDYISRVLKEDDLYLNSKCLSDDAKKLKIKKIISEEKGMLKLFAKIKDRPSFIDLVISYIDLFKRQNLCVEDITKISVEDEITNLKLKELANIYALVSEKMDNTYIDSIDELDLYISKLKKNKGVLLNKRIYFHGYNNFSKKELSVINQMVQSGMNVMISLTLPAKYLELSEYEDRGIFDVEYITYNEIAKLANEAGEKLNIVKLEEDVSTAKEDIKYLAQNIFDIDAKKYSKKAQNINIYLEKNIETEIENIAKDMVKKTRTLDVRWKDFCLNTNDFDTYEGSIKRIFTEYNIPYYFDKKYRIKDSSLIIYLNSLFKISLDEFDSENYVILLKTGLTEIDNLDICYFENYIREFGIKGYMLKNEFTRNNKAEEIDSIVYDLDRLNSIRSMLISSMSDIKLKLNKCKNNKEITEAIYTHLEEKGILAKYGEELDLLEKEDIRIAKLREMVLSKICEVFDNICMIGESSEVKILLKEYVELFEFGVDDVEISTIPMHLDEVEVCDINKSRTVNKKYSYIIGMYEGGMPSLMSEDSVFSDKELDDIKEKGIELKQNSLVRTNMALFNIYICIGKCTENLRISIPSAKMTGEVLRPSSVIRDILQVIDVEIESNILSEDVCYIDEANEIEKTEEVAFREMLSCMAGLDELDNKEIKYIHSLYSYYKDKEKYNKIMQYNRDDNNLSEEVLKTIYGDKIFSSVSKMEAFKRCPFSYFSNYIIKIKPRKEYQMSIMDIGSLMHEVLDKISKYVLEQNIAWHEIFSNSIINEKVKKKLSTVIDELFENRYRKFKESFKYVMLKEKLKQSMYKIIINISKSFNQSEFKPVGYEIEFKDGQLFAPIEIKLDYTEEINGKKTNKEKTMYLVGKIDRVDMAEIGGTYYLRIVDYKSSSKSLKLDDIKEGISIQLMTYMSAILDNKYKIAKEGEVIPAALNYFTLKANVKKFSNYENNEEVISKKIIEDLKLKGIYLSDIKVLEGLDKKYKDSAASYIDVNSKNISDEKKVLTRESFESECKNVKNILKQIGNEIIAGNVRIKPKKVNGKLPCEYCNYLGICRKNCRV